MLKEKTGRRRTKQQVKADKEAAALREKQLAEQERLLASLPADPKDLKDRLDKADAMLGNVRELVTQGHLRLGPNGQLLPNR